ncbi:hypothetical protein QAD02_000679 [Eretmocerus hayati]|uniref:Uncharacterized protein n=1 Tax=Eretmocerus hayati TaxID=131215 RepID=A0ACC2NIN9_9HYME|nr:hypothetical protein QAD02_000679 [Eretmocerus hayati]
MVTFDWNHLETVPLIPGVNRQYRYIGGRASFTLTHCGNGGLEASNHSERGGDTGWQMFRLGQAKRLGVKLSEVLPLELPPCQILHKPASILVSPRLLDEWGIEAEYVWQRRGDTIDLKGYVIHAVFNNALVVAVAKNFSTSETAETVDREHCKCPENERLPRPFFNFKKKLEAGRDSDNEDQASQTRAEPSANVGDFETNPQKSPTAGDTNDGRLLQICQDNSNCLHQEVAEACGVEEISETQNVETLVAQMDGDSTPGERGMAGNGIAELFKCESDCRSGIQKGDEAENSVDAAPSGNVQPSSTSCEQNMTKAWRSEEMCHAGKEQAGKTGINVDLTPPIEAATDPDNGDIEESDVDSLRVKRNPYRSSIPMCN